MRKREAEETEEQKEENGSHQQPIQEAEKTWGGRKAMPEADAELDALLSSGLPKKEASEEVPDVKKEDEDVRPDESSVVEPAQANQYIKPDPDAPEEKHREPLPSLPKVARIILRFPRWSSRRGGPRPSVRIASSTAGPL